MSAGPRSRFPLEVLQQLQRRLDVLPPRHAGRREQVVSVAEFFGVSAATIYRALRDLQKPKPVTRADYGRPRKMSVAHMERYCELVAALKLRTTNIQGCHLSTCHGYKLRDLTEELGVKPREIKALFRNQLEPTRAKELQEKMLAAGLPI